MPGPIPVPFNAPGQWGVNFQERDQLLHPNWATVADSLVLNDAGLLQGRGAFNVQTTTGGASENFRQFVYINAAGTEVVLTTQATKIYAGITDLTSAGGDVTSATAPTAGYWKFANFNGKVVGWQKSHTPIVKTSGDFADIVASTGTLPDGDAMVAAFGRIWAVDDDRQTIRYCALLDETKWDSADGGGAIDMRNVWTQGMDQVMAIAAFGANLVIFGRKHIVFYSDGQGSSIGLDPTQAYVVDTIEGTGCVARDTVASIGEGDLVFLSDVGLQSIRRLVQQKDNPLVTISWQIADDLGAYILADLAALGSPSDDLRSFTGAYLPSTKQYMLTRDSGSTTDVWVFHFDGRTTDEKGRELIPITFWDTEVLSNLKGFITTRAGIVYCTGGASHHMYKYDTSAALDATSTAIAADYESGWLDLSGSPEVAAMQKTLKFGQVTVNNPAGTSSAITFKHAADFNATMTEKDSIAKSATRIVELYDTTGDIEGQYFKMGLSDTSFGRKVIQQMSLYFKPGRTASLHTNTNDVYDQAAVSGATFAGGLYGGGIPLSDQDDDTSGAGLTTYDLTIPITGIPQGTTALLVCLTTNGTGTLSGDVVATLGSSSDTLISLDIPGEAGVAGAFIGILDFDFDADLTPGVAPQITFTRSGGGAFPASWRASYRIWPIVNGAGSANTDSDVDLSGGANASVTLTLTATGAGSGVVAAAYPFVSGVKDVTATLDGVAMTLLGQLSVNADTGFASYVSIFAAEAASASTHTIVLTSLSEGGIDTLFGWCSELDAAA